jgi:hypothetical protein
MRISRSLALMLLLAVGSAAGCATPAPVRAWQREHLAKRAMQFDDGLEARFRSHLFYAREGGFGCN